MLEEGQAIQLVIALRCTDVSVELKRRSAEDPPYVAVQRHGFSVALRNRQVDRCPGTEGLDLARTHLRHVALRLVLVGVVPGAVQVEELGVPKRSQALLGRGPREVVAASAVDEGGRAGSGEGR